MVTGESFVIGSGYLLPIGKPFTLARCIPNRAWSAEVLRRSVIPSSQRNARGSNIDRDHFQFIGNREVLAVELLDRLLLQLRYELGEFITGRSRPGRVGLEKVDDLIQSPEAAQARIVFSESDARFFRAVVKKLPCDDDMNLPVTVDLNG